MNYEDEIDLSANTTATAIVSVTAIFLLLIGGGVILARHSPGLFPILRNDLLAVAFNTATCLLVSAGCLVALLAKRAWLLRLGSLFIVIISALTLLDLFSDRPWGIDALLSRDINDDQINNRMSPTSATGLLLTSCSLFAISFAYKGKKDLLVLLTVFLNIVCATIALIALLGHGIGLERAYMWMGIKIAVPSALGLTLLSLAILAYINRAFLFVFNRLNFFSRIVTGFGFMAMLVLAVGSIALMQINNLSIWAADLYDNPLQVSTAVGRIKSEINLLNRQLKNIAVKPEFASCDLIPEQLNGMEKRIEADSHSIFVKNAIFKTPVDSLTRGFSDWKNFALESCLLLNQNAYEEFSQRTLHGGQDRLLLMESKLDEISAINQEQVKQLQLNSARVQDESRRLIIIIVFGFLIVGILVTGLITRGLTTQLQKIRLSMLRIAQDRDQEVIPFLSHPQEVGDMARALAIFKESSSQRRQLESHLRQVLEAMPNGVIVVDSRGIIETVNEQTEKIFGYDRSELQGKPVEILIPSDAVGKHPNNRDTFFANPSPRVMGAGRELFGLRKDGREFPLEIGLAPMDTTDGKKVLASIVDITERHNADIALNESRERLELTTRINQIGIWEYMVDEGKLIWNDTMFEIYGRKKDFFSADYNAWKQCVHPNDLASTEKLLQESLNNLTPFITKFRIIQPDGTLKYIHAKAKIERTANNKTRMLGTNIDITREEVAFAKLHNTEALRSAIVEFSEDAIISKTLAGIVTSWNIGAANMFGYTADEAIGKPIRELLFPEDLVHQEEMLLAQVRAGMVIKHFETIRQRKDGSLINVSITLSPIKDAHGDIVGISAIKRDISETIKTAQTLISRQQDLEHSNLELARSNKELETFAYVASHDLKSPLRGIAQLSSWIEEDIAEKNFDEIGQHTELLRNRIRRMEKLLDDLLIFYRAGKADGVENTLDVNEMVREIFDIQNNKPGLTLELKNILPKINTFSTPFEQVIRNLLSNAIKHHDREEGVIQFSSRLLDEHFYEFTLCDDGPGIPEKFHERVFGMFQTLRPRDEMEGSGMGLALIKKIVESYGGNIQLKSSGRGACFIFTWPIHIRRSEPDDR